jgi:predicted ATP-dependent endonuclease of OLD family
MEAGRLFRAVSRRAARYSRPIKDSISFTRDIEYAQKRKSDFAGSKLIDEIQSVIGGRYQYAKHQIVFVPKPNGGGKKEIPLHNASSSVQCFALLYFHLCHTARKGQLLIIDEPESHLDTANQIKLARLLARCVNAGLKVLITTHSDYLVKEFNNLIMLSSKFEGKAKLLKKFKYSEDDSLKQENVKAYICENGGLTPCKIDHQGMDMPIFDDAINSISDVSDELAFHLPESA